MSSMTSEMIWQANQQASCEVAEARRTSCAFTLIDMRYDRAVAFINGARSFENARQLIQLQHLRESSALTMAAEQYAEASHEHDHAVLGTIRQA